MLSAAARTSFADAEARKWGVLLHLSLLAGSLVPLAGYVAPVVIWQLKKSEVHGLDAHGRAAANWMVSQVLYLVLAYLSCLVLIGFPMLWALAVVGVLFPIVAAIRAWEGIVWRYPLSLPFFG